MVLDFYRHVDKLAKVYINCEKYAIYSNGYFKDIKKWDIDTVIKANTEINQVCDFIKNNNFSPFEALAFIHNYVSTVAYYSKTKTVDTGCFRNDQFYLGAYMKLPEIVCMGFTALEKEIIDTLNMPGLKCEMLSVEVNEIPKDKYYGHARCYIEIKDDKYGINQSCFDDATWDNKIRTNGTPSYAFFAVDNSFHHDSKNKRYVYKLPYLYVYSKTKVSYRQVNFEEHAKIYNNSKNPIDQLQIEKANFNMLQKIDKDASFDSVYGTLAKMAKQSYNLQLSAMVEGNLKQEVLMLSKPEAKKIYTDNGGKIEEKGILEEYFDNIFGNK